MAKIIVINGIWSTLVCGMLVLTAVLYCAQPHTPEAYGYAQVAQLAQR
jgi:hypothetical protein